MSLGLVEIGRQVLTFTSFRSSPTSHVALATQNRLMKLLSNIFLDVKHALQRITANTTGAPVSSNQPWLVGE
ncbi:hypothetical protein XENOCAPTIV_000179 [Xenoophorus captivus]|uniref:Uncharacterized protein n=1 Tax=Xenoophorus captivus TaxID=1517983 RepID=A0ABV0QXI7_9TELE